MMRFVKKRKTFKTCLFDDFIHYHSYIVETNIDALCGLERMEESHSKKFTHIASESAYRDSAKAIDQVYKGM